MVAVFVVSLLESLFVLPAHLAHTRELSGFWKTFDRPRQWFSRAMQTFIRERYQPFLRSAIANCWLTVAVGLALLILTMGIVAGGHISFSFLPAIDSEIITAQATLPYGAPMEQSRRVLHRLAESANAAIAQLEGESALRGVYAQIGAALMQRGPRQPDSGAMGSHTIGVQVFLQPADQRDFSGADFARVWRASIGTIPGLESLGFKAGSWSDRWPSGRYPTRPSFQDDTGNRCPGIGGGAVRVRGGDRSRRRRIIGQTAIEFSHQARSPQPGPECDGFGTAGARSLLWRGKRYVNNEDATK